MIPSPSHESTLTKLNKIWDQITRDPEWVEAYQKRKIAWDHYLNDKVLVDTLQCIYL